MSDENPISGLEKIHPDTPPSSSDKLAKEGEKALENGNYESLDAHDNYNIRRRVKESFLDKIGWFMYMIIGISLCVSLLFIVLIVSYVCGVLHDFRRVESLLGNIFSHGLVLVLGVFLKFLLPQRKN